MPGTTKPKRIKPKPGIKLRNHENCRGLAIAIFMDGDKELGSKMIEMIGDKLLHITPNTSCNKRARNGFEDIVFTGAMINEAIKKFNAGKLKFEVIHVIKIKKEGK